MSKNPNWLTERDCGLVFCLTASCQPRIHSAAILSIASFYKRVRHRFAGLEFDLYFPDSSFKKTSIHHFSILPPRFFSNSNHHAPPQAHLNHLNDGRRRHLRRLTRPRESPARASCSPGADASTRHTTEENPEYQGSE